MPAHPGLHLTRTEENVAAIDALAALLGGRIGLETMLGDLDRRGRRGFAPGLKVHRSFTFDAADRRDERWWPQGISTSADASTSETIGGRRIVAVSWYAKKLPGDESGNHGSRLTFFDLDTRRYRHVLLVVPTLEDGRLVLAPLRAHAGGIVWSGPYVHVAATAKGFHTCRLDDLLRVTDDLAGPASGIGIEDDRVSSHGYRYVLPVRFAYSAVAADGEERLRYSFMSLDRETTPPSLLVGEYARGKQTRRLARFALDPDTHLLSTAEDGLARPVLLDDGTRRMQGAVMARGRLHVTTSEGPWGLGSLYVGPPGALRRHRWATPMGPEDITYWPSTDLLWSVSEHPRRRWIYAVRRASLD
ncbi:hypothetical protein NPS01_40310 [Nocardioides psychrotolerans]|uniref:Uncharacterized protein n=1 Tax=Nocardioides psychrotolerans TaxID=1005945 RepID=A0A1I3IVA7_9ACTN|nr:hypothetical protein [Nocardioides psychrotolerans]GEP40368.1 hypothetical protein NPS01_40310 [Nocardioides psychrotolerans]SFI51825.1 hypothetical protein SAMN05216561_109156 [Nocardioides psychrotolerans]